MGVFHLLLLSVFLSADANSSSLHVQPGWVAVRQIQSKHAHQAAAAEGDFVYAVSSTTIAKHDRVSGKLLRTATAPDVKHLNSAFVFGGKIYCAHSNYPARPEASDIREYDPASGMLKTFHVFAEPPGSIVWCVRKDNRWWCCFAHYGKENAKTVLVRYDEGWKESGRWTFPKEVVADWADMSASGGIFQGDALLVTHHHFKVIYELKVAAPGVLEFVKAYAAPFPGQGIAADGVSGNLVGIDRNRQQILFAEKAKRP